METKINVAKILKDKPKGTKLYSSACGKCELKAADDKSFKVSFYSSKFGFMNGGEGTFDKNGNLYDDGECVVFPSKEMRDWSKFAWKRGDVLISDCGFVCIFKEWASDDYTRFNGCYFDGMPNAETAKYSKLDNNTAYGYIREIENRCGGKLNLETLKIEKSEFKDGDIVFMREVKSELSANCIFILRGEYNGEGNALYHALYNADDKFVYAEYGSTRVHYNLRPATYEERQRLFDALAKENKKWDAEKKAIVNLPKKSEFKIFQKVLVRNYNGEEWIPGFFFRIHNDGCRYILVCGEIYKQCIPYNDHTEHLLGTTDEWKGGEG